MISCLVFEYVFFWSRMFTLYCMYYNFWHSFYPSTCKQHKTQNHDKKIVVWKIVQNEQLGSNCLAEPLNLNLLLANQTNLYSKRETTVNYLA